MSVTKVNKKNKIVSIKLLDHNQND